jgi:hypothetical protein
MWQLFELFLFAMGVMAIVVLFVVFLKCMDKVVKFTDKKTERKDEATTPETEPDTKIEEAKQLGQLGEDLTYQILEDRIFSRYKLLRNVYVPMKNGKTTEIDMLVISGRGIYVIESKNRNGIIYGRGQDTRWTQFLNKKSKYQMYNPIMQNESHIAALKEHLKGYPDISYFNIVVFNEGSRLKVTDITNAYLITRDKLNKTIDEIANTNKDTISDTHREEVIKRLALLAQPNAAVKEQHVKQFSK